MLRRSPRLARLRPAPSPGTPARPGARPRPARPASPRGPAHSPAPRPPDLAGDPRQGEDHEVRVDIAALEQPHDRPLKLLRRGLELRLQLVLLGRLARHLVSVPPRPAAVMVQSTLSHKASIGRPRTREPASSARAPSAKHSVISGLIDMTPSSCGKRRAVPRFRGAGRAKGRGLHRGPTPPRMSSRRLVTNGPCSIAGTVPTMSTITRPIVDGCPVGFHYAGQTFPPRTSEEMIEVEARGGEGDPGRRKLIRRSRTRRSERSRETAMSNDDRRCLVLAEISNGTRMECHLTEVEIDLTFRNVIDWVKTRNSHLCDDLRGTWTYADVYIVAAGKSFDQKRYALTIRNRRGELSRL